MGSLQELKKKVLNGKMIDKGEAVSLINVDLDQLRECAEEIRNKFCGNLFNLCTIINGKSGRCSENCKYCAQSIHFKTNIEEYDILDKRIIIDSAKSNYNQGVHKFAIVTSGKKLTKEQLKNICDIYKEIHKECPIELCASHGLLSYEDLTMIKKAGVIRYHNNLETSRNYFSKICTTHTYDEKIQTIKNAKKAGLQVCSGGIIGLGESMEDRIDMALTLREINVNSIPINVLNPIKGTPLENAEILQYEEVMRTLAIFRFIHPKSEIRLAGGRALLGDKGVNAMKSGVNAAISGDLLTTSGIKTNEDIKILKELGFQVIRK
ncbi:MAG: biotin synthase BioB [Clostridium butyricum]|nr:biotin synthase BioB [Clostridium butyricum]